MFLKPEERNIVTGILGTVLIHLVFLIIFLIVQLNVINTKKEEQVIVEFDEEVYKAIQEAMNENKNLQSDVQSLSQKEYKNIAVNTANNLKDEISTDKYINDLKNELGIKDPIQNQEILSDDGAGGEETNQLNEKPVVKEKDKPYKGPSILNYYLEKREKKYMPVPAFQCRGAGIITIGIVVNPKGEVISAIVESTTSSEECISETALNAAKSSRFNIDLGAEPKQKGTITYQYMAQ